MNILLLGAVNPFDFNLSDEDHDRLQGFHFVRSVPVSDLAESLVELGHTVTIIGIASIAETVLSLTTTSGVNLVYVRGRRHEKLKAITFYSVERESMLRQIMELKPDVVHAHWTYEYALTAQDSGLPHLITVHDEPWEILAGFRNVYFFLRLLNAILVRLRRSQNLVFVSEYMRILWNNRMFASGGYVIPNMNRLSKNSVIKSPHYANNVVAVGNTDRRKNIRGLLVAWEMVVLVNPNLRLHLVGPGLGKGDSLAEEFKDKFNAQQVTWHGSLTRRQLGNLYGDCSVLVHPSRWESFGLIYLEAFAFNLGVITLAKSGSTAEVVGDAGLVLSEDSPKSISEAILRLTSSQSMLDQLTEIGRARLSLFSSSEITGKYISLYEKISSKSE